MDASTLQEGLLLTCQYAGRMFIFMPLMICVFVSESKVLAATAKSYIH